MFVWVHCVILCFLVTSILPGTADEGFEDDEETFVRLVVTKMMGEEGNPVKGNSDQLTETARRLETLEANVARLHTTRQTPDTKIETLVAAAQTVDDKLNTLTTIVLRLEGLLESIVTDVHPKVNGVVATVETHSTRLETLEGNEEMASKLQNYTTLQLQDIQEHDTKERDKLSKMLLPVVHYLNETDSKLARLESYVFRMGGLVGNQSVVLMSIANSMELDRMERRVYFSRMNTTFLGFELLKIALGMTRDLTAHTNSEASRSTTYSSREHNLSTELLRSTEAANLINTTRHQPIQLTTASPKVVPFDCGGVVEEEQSGELQFEAPKTLAHQYACVWTIQTGAYTSIRIKLVEENFAASKAKMRLMPMHGMMWNSYNGSGASLGQKEWNEGSQGSPHTLLNAVLFVELVVHANASIPPKFVVSFSGSGSPTRWSSFAMRHSYLSKRHGIFYRVNSAQEAFHSFVVVPNSDVTTYIHGMGNLQGCTTCDCFFLRIWRLGSQSLIGRGDHAYRFCGRSTHFYNVHDDVGYIIVYWSGAKTTGNFSMEYGAQLN